MIFNPLFFNDNGNNQLSVSQPNKLKNNKYLFSDIVKIVMNNKQNQNKLFDSELDITKLGNISLTPQLKFASINPETTQQLKFDFISNSENEKVKTELADILPDDMAKLLVDDIQTIDEKKIISYVGKEPLNEELKQFLTNLIGSELIEKHVNNETGLILNLEDSKSAVNIELTKEYSSNNNSDKIIVQTLLVPQKSKLQSLLEFGNKNEDRNLNLFAGKNISQSKKQILENLKTNNNQIKEQINETITNRPTLSVFSFKYNTDSILKESNSLKEIIPSVYNIKDLKSDQNEVIHKFANQKNNTPIEKISFIPSSLKSNLNGENEEIQNSNKGVLNNTETKTLKNYARSINSSSNLKLFESKVSEEQKEINVTKITIMKKQTNELIEYQNKLKIENNKVDAEVRRIDFKNLVNKSTTSLRLLKNIDKNNPLETGRKSINNVELNKDIKENISLNKNQNNEIGKSKINVEEIKLPTNTNETKSIKSNTENQGDKIFTSKENKNEKLSTAKEKSNLDQKHSEKLSVNKNIEEKNSAELKSTEKNIVSDKKNVNINEDPKLFSRKINIENLDLSKKEIPNQIKTNDETKEIKDEKKESIQNKIAQSDESKSKKIVNDKINLTSKENIKDVKEKDTASKSEAKSNDVKQSDKTNIEQMNVKESIDKNEIKLNITNDEFKHIGKKEEIKSNLNKIEFSEKLSKSELKNEKLLANELTEKLAKDESVNSNKENLNNINAKENDVADETENDNKMPDNQKENVNNKPKTKVNDENQIFNKELTLKIKGEVKSVNNKGVMTENQNTISETKFNNLNTEGDSWADDENPTSRQSLKSNNNTELKEKSESIFTKELKNEGIKQNNFAKFPTEEMKNDNSNRIVKSIEVIKELTKFITKQEEGTLSFNIKPEKLGQLKITLETINNSVRANIEVENEQAKQLIERNINQLYKQLNENEIQLSSLNISLSNPKKENAARNHSGESSKNGSSEFAYDAEEKTEKKSRSLGYNTYEYLA